MSSQASCYSNAHMTDADWTVRMEERREPTGGNFNGGFKEFICEEDFHDEEHPHHQSNRHQGIIN